MKKKILGLVLAFMFVLPCIMFAGCKSEPKKDVDITVINKRGEDITGKYVITMDPNGNYKTVISYQYDEYEKEYFLSDKIENEYNEKGKVVSRKYYSWDSETEDWCDEGFSKVEFSYDSHGNKVKEAEFYWNEELNEGNGDWQVSWECTYEYDSNDRLISVNQKGYDGDELEYDDSSEFSYSEEKSRSVDYEEILRNFG